MRVVLLKINVKGGSPTITISNSEAGPTAAEPTAVSRLVLTSDPAMFSSYLIGQRKQERQRLADSPRCNN